MGLAEAHLAGAGVGGATAVDGRLVGGNVFGAGDVFAGARFIAGHLFGTAHFIAGNAVAVAGVADPHLGGLGGHGAALTEGLEHLGAQVFGAGDRPAGGGLIAGGLHRAVGLGAGDDLAAAGFAYPHLPMGVSGGLLLGAMTVGATGTGSRAIAGAASTAHLGFQFPHLLRQLAAGEVGVALAGHRCRGAAGGDRCRLTALGECFAAS